MKSTITKLLMTAVSVVAMGAAAQAGAPAGPAAPADNPIVNIFDGPAPGTVSVGGITVYGTIDVGMFYQAHSSRAAGSDYIGVPYVISPGTTNPFYINKSKFSYQNNAMSQSQLGVKGSQSIGTLLGVDGLRSWQVGFDSQIGFDPLYGDVADICKAMVHNNGIAFGPATAGQYVFGADGSRCGQIFNGEVFASLKNDVLGELRFGRQNTLLLSALGAYDSQAGSYSMSLFAFSGTFGGGAGATEDARWNNAIKYTNTIGPVRVGAAYRFEGGGQGGDAYGLQAGIDLPGALKGLSIDGVFQHENSAINAGSLSAANCTDVGGLNTSVANCQNTNVLAGTVVDAEAWAIMAKYKFDDATFFKGLIAMGGYEHITRSNGASPLDNLNTIGGYSLLNGTGSDTVNYFRYVTDLTFDVYWLGGKYAITPKLSAAAAWYHVDQGSYTAGSPTNHIGTTCAATALSKVGVTTPSNCAGSLNEYSVSLDYQLTKRLDLYAGVQWVDVSGGFANGLLVTNDYTLVSGARFRF